MPYYGFQALLEYYHKINNDNIINNKSNKDNIKNQNKNKNENKNDLKKKDLKKKDEFDYEFDPSHPFNPLLVL